MERIAGFSTKSNILPKLNKEYKCALTNRMIEYVVLAALGFSNQEIADVLCVTKYTVKKTLEDVFDRINAINRANMVDIAWTHNFLNNDIKRQIIERYNIAYPLVRKRKEY